MSVDAGSDSCADVVEEACDIADVMACEVINSVADDEVVFKS